MGAPTTPLLERLRVLIADPRVANPEAAAFKTLVHMFARVPVAEHDQVVEQLEAELRDDANPATRRLETIVLPASIWGLALAELQRRRDERHGHGNGP